MFCIAPLWTLALGLLLLNESLTKQLRFPHAPALTHTYLYTHVPAPSWTEPARSPCPPAALGFALARQLLPGKPCVWGGFIPAHRDGLGLTRAVLWMGRAVTSLPPCPPTPWLVWRCLQEHGFLWAVLPAPSTEPSTWCWITVWNATGCQILDSLFLMKIPPVIPRISWSAKKMSGVCILL